jgi:hypothetical protein
MPTTTREAMTKEKEKLYITCASLGTSVEEEWPRKINTLPTTNQIAKKQSDAILK